MTKEVNQWFETYTENAEKGLYQMPKDVFHYTHVGTDSDGLSLYQSELGTNVNEILHKNMQTLLGHLQLVQELLMYLQFFAASGSTSLLEYPEEGSQTLAQIGMNWWTKHNTG